MNFRWNRKYGYTNGVLPDDCMDGRRMSFPIRAEQVLYVLCPLDDSFLLKSSRCGSSAPGLSVHPYYRPIDEKF